MAGKRHGHGMLCVNRPLMTYLKISFRHTHGNNESNQLKLRRNQTSGSTVKRLFQPHVGPTSALKSPKLVTHFTLSGGTPLLFLRVFKAHTITKLSFYFYILYNDQPTHNQLTNYYTAPTRFDTNVSSSGSL